MKPLYLVTGAAGFVGRHVVDHLVAKGYRVRAMVRRHSQAEALHDVVEDVVIADLEQPETLAPAVAGVAGIFHIAALFRQDAVPDHAFHDINVAGVAHLIDAAVAAGVPRFVHCSTNGVHGHVEVPPANEGAPYAPGDLYQESKLEGERVVMNAFSDGRIEGVVLRPAMIYGPGDARILKLFRMIAKGRFFYVGRGEALTHWLDVRDLAEAFRLGMEARDVSGEAFLIAGDRYRTLKESSTEIARQLGVSEPWLHIPVGPMMALAWLFEVTFKPFGIEPPLFRRRVSFFLKNRAFDISKAQKMLNYQPAKPFEDEVGEIIEAYRQSGDLPAARRSSANAIS